LYVGVSIQPWLERKEGKGGKGFFLVAQRKKKHTRPEHLLSALLDFLSIMAHVNLEPSMMRLIKTQAAVANAAGTSAARALIEVQQRMIVIIADAWYAPYKADDERALLAGNPVAAHHLDAAGLQRAIATLNDANLASALSLFCTRATQDKAVDQAPLGFPLLTKASPKARVHFSISLVKRQMLAIRRVLFNPLATLGVVAMCEFLLVRLVKNGFLLTQADRRVRLERRDVVRALEQDPVLFAWLKRPALAHEEGDGGAGAVVGAAAAAAAAAADSKKKKKRGLSDPAPRVEKPKKKKVQPAPAAAGAIRDARQAEDDDYDELAELIKEAEEDLPVEEAHEDEDDDEFAIADT
jgi:hypothetical protein